MSEDRNELKRVFISNLRRAMDRKGWNQAELARKAQLSMPEGKSIAIHNVNSYIRGRSIPEPSFLNAMADALGVEPLELLPNRVFPSTGNAIGKDRKGAAQLQIDGDGAILIVNQRVPLEVGMEIMRMLSRV